MIMAIPLKTKELRRSISTVKNILSSKEIRKRFLDYFIDENEHQYIKSCSVFPYFDSSIPFVNAGMCQFKRIFTSREQIQYSKAANSQKCIRIAGKHNDLQVVGIDSYHHTFFEMLGNWSFGSYDKKQACKLAWELLTSSPYNIPQRKLFITYFGGDNVLNLPADDEVREIWLELGVKPDHILPFGTKENFWEMGTVGPCGTCTEIHVALTDELCSANLVNKNNPLLTELWNIVFIRYNRNENGAIESLSKEYIDTGMGFERLVTLLQDKTSNYDSDLFSPLFETISKVTGALPYRGTFGKNDLDSCYRYLADFSRMITVAISDDVFPDANAKLKRVLRKALFIAEKKFNSTSPDILINELANVIAEYLHETFPEIGKKLPQVKNVIENEAKQIKCLENNNSKHWKEILSKYPILEKFSFTEYPGLPVAYQFLMDQLSKNNFKEFLPPQIVVSLYITHGLESDIIEQLLEPFNLKYDTEEVKNLLDQIRLNSKLQQRRTNTKVLNLIKDTKIKTDDSFKYKFETSINRGYEFPIVSAEILNIIDDKATSTCDRNITNLSNLTINSSTPQKKEIAFICDKTNFYTTAGGQCHDVGTVTFPRENGDVSLKIHKVEKLNDVVFHYVYLDQIQNENLVPFKIGDKVILKIDADRRFRIMKNHTAAHLLNSALKEIFPISHFKNGSINDQSIISNYSVYGYSYNEDHDLIEKIVKSCIDKRLPVSKIITSSTLEVTNLPGIVFTPGETYDPDNIHVLSILDHDGKIISRELCCGTHLNNTQYIEDFCITKMSFSKSLSTLAVEAVVGDKAKKAFHFGKIMHNRSRKLISEVNNLLNEDNDGVSEILKAYQDLSDLLFELKYHKDFVKDSLPYRITDDFHKLKALQRRMNKIVSPLSRETIATELIHSFYESSSQNVIANFISFKHEALRDYEFLKKLVNLTEFTTGKKCPILSMTYVDGAIRCLGYVPEEKLSEHFNARVWLSSILATSSSVRVNSEDPQFSYIAPKKTSEEYVHLFVNEILERTKTAVFN